MDIYITNLMNMQTMRVPMLPQEIKGNLSNKHAQYSIMQVGEVRVPTGTAVDAYEWESYFPGYDRMEGEYLRAWAPPKECDRFIQSLLAEQGTPAKARLMVTETNINTDVYLDSYQPTETGGYGDIKYTIKFIKAKTISVTKVMPVETEIQNQPPADAVQRTDTQEQAAKTYTVVPGDTLWKIAQAFYGSGALYPLIYAANAATIGANPNLIYAGQVFVIP